MLDNTDPHEFKAALAHFIERIEISGQDVEVYYSIAPPMKGIVPVNGDPGGIRTPDLHRDRVAC
jgi:hypothetical protein